MKTKILLIAFVLVTTISCQVVNTSQDYLVGTNFAPYKTYAFYKPGIDEAEISDLDKKRILKAIDDNLQAKGFTKTKDDPDMLISFFTETRERVDVDNWGWGFGWGWGWGWGWGGVGPGTSVSSVPEGTLYIDFIDTDKKELIWQGVGTARLYQDVERKTERINEIVTEILKQYPPEVRR
jgi:hypothetical protein